MLNTKPGDFERSSTSQTAIFMHLHPEIHIFPFGYWIYPGYN